MVLLSEQRVNTLEIVKFATWASMSVLRISKISFVRELFGRGVYILCGGVSSSSSTFRTFALLWVGRGFKAKAAYFLLSWTCCVHGHDHAPCSILHVSSTGLEWVTTPYHLATSITTNTTSVWCCCLFLALFAVLNGCWTTDGRTERQTDRQMDEHSGRTFQYVTARICGELQNTLNSMSNVGVCPLVRCGRLTQFSFIGKVDVFLYFFCLLFIATIFRVLLPLRFCFRCESLIFISLLCHQSSE